MHLTRRITIGILLILFCLPVMAQVGEPRSNFSIGVNGGVNLNSVSFTPTIKQGSLTGITGGLTARYISEKYFAMICGIQMELNYSQHGWKERYDDSTDSYSRMLWSLEAAVKSWNRPAAGLSASTSASNFRPSPRPR